MLLHEFGHFASPRNEHTPVCWNTPMIVSLAPGEWWHTRSDWYFRGCGMARPRAAAAAAGEGRRLRFEHREVVVERVELR